MPWERTKPLNLLPMASITYVSDWLILLKLLWLNTWENIDPTGQVWSICIRVVTVSWWSRGQSKNTAIIWRRKRRYSKLTFLESVLFTGYVIVRSRFTRSGSESSNRCTTSYNHGTRGRLITSEYKPGASIKSSAKQYLYGDTSGHPWINHCID